MWHCTLLAKMAGLKLPFSVYNWLVEFFHKYAYRTTLNAEESSTANISASIIQESSIGPTVYTVTAADDTYLIIPSAIAGMRQQEMDNIVLKVWCVRK